jgi:hypothetical protein
LERVVSVGGDRFDTKHLAITLRQMGRLRLSTSGLKGI